MTSSQVESSTLCDGRPPLRRPRRLARAAAGPRHCAADRAALRLRIVILKHDHCHLVVMAVMLPAAESRRRPPAVISGGYPWRRCMSRRQLANSAHVHDHPVRRRRRRRRCRRRRRRRRRRLCPPACPAVRLVHTPPRLVELAERPVGLQLVPRVEVRRYAARLDSRPQHLEEADRHVRAGALVPSRVADVDCMRRVVEMRSRSHQRKSVSERG